MATKTIDVNSGTGVAVGGILLIWAGVIAVAATGGWLTAMPNIGVPAITTVGIAGPMLAYATSPALRAWFARIGLRRLTLFHAWRIGAAALFFVFGADNVLPPALVLRAGLGDLIAGLLALIAVALPFARWRYWAVHLFGAADLLLAMGTGVYLSYADPASMTNVRYLPFALIPMFGVAVTFVAHLIAFDLLRHGRKA